MPVSMPRALAWTSNLPASGRRCSRADIVAVRSGRLPWPSAGGMRIQAILPSRLLGMLPVALAGSLGVPCKHVKRNKMLVIGRSHRPHDLVARLIELHDFMVNRKADIRANNYLFM
jgi:hypothetical protein